MKWFINLFKNKSQESSESYRKWSEGFDAYEIEKVLFSKRKAKDALQYFDKAIEIGFKNEVFEFRARCVQELDYHYDAIADFDEAIRLSSKDCNLYFSRSVSKGAIKEYIGEISDLKKAVELSKENNELNRIYNDEAEKMGYKNGIAEMFQMRLVSAELDLEFEKEEQKRMINASPKMKVILEEMELKRTNLVKRRGNS